MISITVENLTKRFGSVTALEDVSFTIEPGELFFLLGPSGCGKTTLLRSLAGFYTPEEGAIYFDQDDVTLLPPHKRETAMMFQSYALWPHMSVAKNVAFGLEERRVPKAEIEQRVREALAVVQMSQYIDRKPNELSGGQQQRIALARALVVRPRCLLLDEPLSNLDAKLRLEMRSEIRRICKEFGLTAIYVTHDQKEALSIADRMAVMEGGHLAQVGTPREVYHWPQNRLVADFIGETNFIEGELVGPLNAQEEFDQLAVNNEQNPDDQWRDYLFAVRTTCGDFMGVNPRSEWNPSPGSRVVLSIRPECWKLSEKRPKRNALAGSIDSTIYLGEVAQYRFAPETSHPLRIFELNPSHLQWPEDKMLYAHVHPRDVIILGSE